MPSSVFLVMYAETHVPLNFTEKSRTQGIIKVNPFIFHLFEWAEICFETHLEESIKFFQLINGEGSFCHNGSYL
jgi:hypothetical protein